MRTRSRAVAVDHAPALRRALGALLLIAALALAVSGARALQTLDTPPAIAQIW